MGGSTQYGTGKATNADVEYNNNVEYFAVVYATQQATMMNMLPDIPSIKQ